VYLPELRLDAAPTVPPGPPHAEAHGPPSASRPATAAPVPEAAV